MRMLLKALPVICVASGIVYATAPLGGYQPWETTNPECIPWDIGCFVQVPWDDQTLTLSGNTLSILDGNSVSLENFVDTDTHLTEAEVDSYVSNNHYLTGYTDTDEQTLSFSGSSLSITRGNTIDLSSLSLWNAITGVPADLLDGDDNTQLSEAEVDNYVANNGYLTGYTDTDEQTLNLSGTNISISNGNSINLKDTFVGKVGGFYAAGSAISIDNISITYTNNRWYIRTTDSSSFIWQTNGFFSFGVSNTTAPINRAGYMYSARTISPNNTTLLPGGTLSQGTQVGSSLTTTITDRTNGRMWRYTIIIAPSGNPNAMTLERMF